jgi:hypothetical protein
MTGRQYNFRKGQLRGQAARVYVPIGTVRTRMHCGVMVRWVKFADVPGATGRNWKLYATWLWEQSHGPVPRGHCVIHRDFDRLNDDPGNLECVTESRRLLRALAAKPGALARRGAKIAAARRVLRESRKVAAEIRRVETTAPVTEPTRSAKEHARARVAEFLAKLTEAA